jgi:hypothetical protein
MKVESFPKKIYTTVGEKNLEKIKVPGELLLRKEDKNFYFSSEIKQ